MKTNEWPTVALKRLVRFGNGKDHSSVEDVDGQYPVFGSGGPFACASDYLYDGESVLFGRKGTIDKPRYVNGRFWTVDTMYFTIIGQNLIPRWLYYWATTIPFSKYATNTALPSMTSGLLGSLRLRLPSLLEQQQIADYLDRETAEIDAFISDLDDYSALLSYRLDSERDRAFLSLAKASASVPLKRWLEIPLSYGATESADHFNPSEIRYLRITDFGTNGNLRPETAASLPYEAAAGYMTAPGDILLARSGATVGKAFMVPDSLPQACFAGYLVRARFQNREEAGFVWHALQTTSYKDWILANATVATIQNVSAQKFGTYPIPRPSRAVQAEIIGKLDQTQRNIDHSRALAAEAKALAEERRMALISAAVTGQIDVTAQGVSAADQLRDELEVHI